MARPLRLSFEDGVYHITARGNRRENIFNDDRDRHIFFDKLNETFEKYSFVCYAYCLMGNHYHLFIKTPLANISEGMHYLNASYANWFKARHKIVGVIFQGRYKSIVVDEDNYAIQLSVYIHVNPLRAGIVEEVRDYRWSSYLDYLGDKRSLERLDSGFILNQFDSDLETAKRKYESYVLDNLSMEDPLKKSCKGMVLGSDRFVNKMKERIRSVGEKREISDIKAASAHTAEEIIQQIMREMLVDRYSIFEKTRGNIYRPMALYLLKRYTALSLREIGEMFDMDYSAVSKACSRYEKIMRERDSEEIDMSNVET